MGRADEAAQWRRYARLTESHFSPDETIEFHTEWLEEPTDVTEVGDDEPRDEAQTQLTDSELADLVSGVPPVEPLEDSK
jgi:hypothetical protein